jgi:hypothetical protein
MKTDNQNNPQTRELTSLLTCTSWIVISSLEYVLSLDDVCLEYVSRANFLASYRAVSSLDAAPQRCNIYDFYQQPISGYIDKKNRFRVMSGLFSYSQFCKLQTEFIPVLLFNKAPSVEIRRKMILSELTRTVLDQQPSRGVEQLNELLCAWFNTDTQGVFKTPEWKSLYPGIENKSQFCKWLKISSKTFRDKNGASDADV